MNALMFSVENVLEALSADSRQPIKFPEGRNSIWVRDLSFAVLLEKGLIPAAAGLGWVNDRKRRKECTSAGDACLDGLNRLFSRAKTFYGEDGKKTKSTDKRDTRREPTYYVSYLRVSTKAQGDSGLGLEVQRDTNNQYITEDGGHLLQEYIDVMSGRDKNRPKVMEAIRHCDATGATLIVTRVNRLGRNVSFITGVQEYGFPLLIAEYPTATPRQIAELAIQAQYDSEEKREITKAALSISTKPKGVKGSQNLHKNPGAAEKGRALGGAAMKEKADLFAKRVRPLIENHLKAGLDLVQIADKLNVGQILTARGERGKWTQLRVRSVLARAATWSEG